MRSMTLCGLSMYNGIVAMYFEFAERSDFCKDDVELESGSHTSGL